MIGTTQFIKRLSELLEYDPEGGTLVWREDRVGTKPRKKGQNAHCSQGRATRIRELGGTYRTASVVFAMYHGRWPKGVVDHINGSPLDFRITNLREATNSQNSQNRRMMSNNTIGYTGVRKNYRPKGCFEAILIHASTKSGEKRVFTKSGFKTAFGAAVYRDMLAKKHHGEFARLNFPGQGKPMVRPVTHITMGDPIQIR